MASDIVVYWHRLGLKVYSLDPTPTIIKEISSNDIVELEEQLKFIANQKVYLLLSDSISYLFTKEISPPLPLDSNFRDSLLSLIKSDIPEDFSSFSWDYKIEKSENEIQKVVIFAPTKEIQILIDDISQKLLVKFIAIEPESISSVRDPNPIIGITRKDDLSGKDEEVLNITFSPVTTKKKSLFPIFILIFIIINLVAAGLYFRKPSTPTKTQIVPTSTPIPTIEITPTPEVVTKKLTDLTVVVQNGTAKSGYASTKAMILKTAGIINVDTGNADVNTYQDTKLIFKDQATKDQYQSDLIKLIPVIDANISVDTNQIIDVKFILGIN